MMGIRIRVLRSSIAAALCASSAVAFQYLDRYSCGVCHEVLEGASCDEFNACHAISASVLEGGCKAACHTALPLQSRRLQAAAPNIRVAKGFGTKAYDQVRVSVISGSSSPPVSGFFDYSAQFKYRWTGNYLHTAMKSAAPGQSVEFDVGAKITVKLPKQGAGVAGLMIADPCVNGKWVGCEYLHKFDTYNRTPAIINTFVPDESTDFWGLYGDNFYDQTGEITNDVFDRISVAAKSKIFNTVPGNHDYWVYGFPPGLKKDQCGNGHMQYYAQDAKAAQNVSAGSKQAPFDFSVDPDKHSFIGIGCGKAATSNSFWYNQIGNLGIVGQSGAYSLKDVTGFMTEACAWLAEQPGLDVALLVGHWDTSGDGADSDMAMPGWYHEMAKLPGCAEFDKRGMLKFVMGHTHCNDPHPRGNKDIGFRVAGFGMEGCGNYGVPIIDTTEGRVRFWYFDTSDESKFNAAIQCVEQKGWRQCTNLATLWLDQQIVPGLRSHEVQTEVEAAAHKHEAPVVVV